MTVNGDGGPSLVQARADALRRLAERLAAEGDPYAERLTNPIQRGIAGWNVTSLDEVLAHPQLVSLKAIAPAIADALAEAAAAAEGMTSPQIAANDGAGTPQAAPPTSPAPPPAPGFAQPGAVDADLSSLRFAAYTGTVPPGEIAAVQIARTPDGTHVLTWPAGSGAYVDRVIRGDQHPPYTPDGASLVGLSDGVVLEDSEPFQHALRHYQVWRHSGATLAEAAMAQPVIVAMGLVVAPPRGIEIGVDSGAVVTATWEAEAGTAAIAVYRVPVEQAFGAGFGNRQYRILADRPLRGGFSDGDAQPGKRYIYQLIAEAAVNGEVHTSAPVVREIHVPESHEPVGDLAFALRETAASAWFDLAWTDPPGGRVVIYRTTALPAAGYDLGAIAATALPAAGLPAEARLNHPVDREGGKATMHNVPWPREWAKAFFTPVVELGESAYLGNTITGIRVPPVQRMKLIERVEQKLITFDFPDGANEVRVYVGPRDADPAGVTAGPSIAAISRAEYEAFGSLQLTRQHLPQPCDIHLVAFGSHGTETVRSAPATISYTPVLVVDYRVTFGIGLTVSARRPKVTIQSERDLQLDPGIGLVLGYHPDRLPLTVSDATAHVALVRDVEEATTAVQRILVQRLSTSGHSEPGWKADPGSWSSIASSGGYVRLFVDDPRYQPYVALLDPAVGALRVGGLLRR
jgi:hypothetical protein